MSSGEVDESWSVKLRGGRHSGAPPLTNPKTQKIPRLFSSNSTSIFRWTEATSSIQYLKGKDSSRYNQSTDKIHMLLSDLLAETDAECSQASLQRLKTCSLKSGFRISTSLHLDSSIGSSTLQQLS
jgi:hypothetical protein